MKICFVTHTYPPSLGGVATSVKRLAQMLSRAGYSIYVSTISQKVLPGEIEITEEDNILVSRMGKYPLNSDTKTFWLDNICHLIDEHEIKILHAYYVSRGGFIATMASRLKGCKAIISIRGNDLEKDILSGSTLPLIEWSLANCNVITSVSKNLSEIASVIVPGKNIKIIHNSVDTKIFNKIHTLEDKPLSIPENEPVIGFVGEAKIKKGIYTLLRAFELVLEAEKAHLFITGHVRQDMADLIKYFQDKNPLFKDFLHIFPPVLPEDINKIYNLLDIFVMPSLKDGMPNAVLEAMACEVPVVATFTGGMPEMIVQEESGILVPPGDEKSLSKALLKLITSPELRIKIGKSGRKRVLEHFSREKEMKSNIDIYNSFIGHDLTCII